MHVTVWTTADLPGFHRWPDAPERRRYLRDRHRHLFHVYVAVRVPPSTATADDNHRAVEFHDLQDHVREWWGPEPRDWFDYSCERIAADLLHVLVQLRYDVDSVEVSEDGESGATIQL